MQHPSTEPDLPAALSEADYRSIGEFRRAMREFLSFSETGARRQGLTSQQHQALLAIKSHQGGEAISVSELADRLMIKTHSCVGLVSRLVERDLAARQPSACDRRRVCLALTPRGEAALEAITLANLDQLGGLANILDELLQTVRHMERRAPPKGG